MAIGSLESNYYVRNIHKNKNDLIRKEQSLIKRNNKSLRVSKVAPRNAENFLRLRRKYNKYGSKGKLQRPYKNGQPNPKLTRVRNRYTTQRQCRYIPKTVLMKMAKDLGIREFKNAEPNKDFKKGSALWKAHTMKMICEKIRDSGN